MLSTQSAEEKGGVAFPLRQLMCARVLLRVHTAYPVAERGCSSSGMFVRLRAFARVCFCVLFSFSGVCAFCVVLRVCVCVFVRFVCVHFAFCVFRVRVSALSPI